MANRWKQRASFVIVMALLCSLVFPNLIFAAYTHTPVSIPTTPASPIKITLNGKNVRSVDAPKFIDGKIWVSAEAMAHYFYAVYYESIDGKQFVMKNDYYSMTAEYGKDYVVLGDSSTVTTDLPFKEGVRSWIPLDTLMYAFGATYTWNAVTNTAAILYDEARHLADEAAIPAATASDITLTPKSRDAFYRIPVSDPNATVTVWRKSGTPDNYLLETEPTSTGYAWVIQPAPHYNPATGSFEGGVSYTNATTVVPETIRVKIKYSDGVTPDKVFKKSYSTTSKGYTKIPDYDFLLRSTFNNISVYMLYTPPYGTGYTSEDLINYTLPVPSPNTLQVPLDPANEVRYRKVGDTTWKQALPLAYDAQTKNFRGSIVGLEPDTNYQVEVKVLNDNYTRTSTIRTWKENVPIAQDIPIASIYQPGKPLSIAGLHGTENGYIRIIGDGSTVIEVTDEFWEAVAVAQSQYVILENLIIRGGKRSAISVLSSADHIRIVNCDISNFGRTSTQYLGANTIISNTDPNLAVDLEAGFPYTANGVPVAWDAGIYITDANYIVIEKNYIHDPKGISTAWNGGGGEDWYENAPGLHQWTEKHPLGVDGIYLRGGIGMVIRYNDIIGSDDHRFNYPISGVDNHKREGGVGSDSDVYGNYLANAQADGIELEGADMNVRFYENKIEGTSNGLGMDSNYIGPLYVYRNLITNMGDEFGLVTGMTKHGMDPADWVNGIGVNYLFNNTFISPMNNFAPKDTQLYRAVYRNNIMESIDSPVGGQDVTSIKHIYNYPGVSYDYDLVNGAGKSIDATSTGGPAPIVEPHGFTGVKTGVAFAPDSTKKATFTNRAEGDYSQTSASLGFDSGTTIPNFVTAAVYSGAAPDIGAIESGMNVMIPSRPIALRAKDNKYQVNITGNATKTVTLTTYGVPTGTTYDLKKNKDFDWFTVTNAAGTTSGTITEGVDLVLTVTGDPKQIGKNFLGEPFGTTITKGLADLRDTAANVVTGQPGVGKGAFFVELHNGYSLPVSVFVTAGNYNATYTLTYKDVFFGVAGEGDPEGIVQQTTIYANGSSLGQTVTPPTLYKNGARFLGWYDETYAHKYDFSKPIEKNTVLYAKWQVDLTPPVTTASVAGTAGSGGWYKSDVTVTLTASDISPIYATYYIVNSGGTNAYISPITVTNGIYEVQYRSKDIANNMEAFKTLTVKSDKIAPTYSLSANGNPLTEGAQFEDSQPVTISVVSADSISGVASVAVTVDGQPYVPGTPINWSGQLGSHAVHVAVTDQAGNVSQGTTNVAVID